MSLLFATSALAATVTLNVGVHVDAGTVADIAADGASGQCTIAPSALVCPADGPVTFRWGKGGPWEMTGDTVVEPGHTGVAWVLAPDAERETELMRLRGAVNADVVREYFQRQGTVEPPVPSYGMLAALISRTQHPDPVVRRIVVDVLMQWTWRSSLGPLPPTAPVPIPPGVLTRLSQDTDVRVRRKTGALIRSMRPGDLSDEAGEALARLAVDDAAGVRAEAFRASARGELSGASTVEEAWERAMQGLTEPGTSGRAAAGTLAYLATVAGPEDHVDPVAAVERTLLHHPNQTWKVWARWRDRVPFRSDWALILLRDTWALSPGLVKHWAESDPDGLAQTLRTWESSAPHSSRFELVASHLVHDPHPAIRAAISDGSATSGG